MMHCQRVQRLIGVYRELDRAEARMVDAHLRGCDACRAAWSDEQRVRKYLAGLPILDAPRGLQPQLLAIPATVAATPGLLAFLMRLLGLLLLGFGLATVAGDSSNIAPSGRGDGLGRAMAPASLLETEAPRDGEGSPRQARSFAAPLPAPVSRDAQRPLETPGPALAAASPASLSSSGAASNARASKDRRRGPLAALAPTAAGNPRQGSRSDLATAPADAVAPPTVPASRTPPPLASCPALMVQIYADVGIESTAVDDCVHCDGILGPADRSAWLESDHALPDGLQLSIVDALGGEILFDERIKANGQALITVFLASAEHAWICDRDRINLRLGMPSSAFEEGWTACPRGPGHQRSLDLRASRSVAIGLARACPTLAEPPTPPPTKEAPPPSATARPEPEPSPSRTEAPPAPSATPAPPRATEDPDPEPEPEPGPGAEPTGTSGGSAPDPEPGGPPSGAPSPSPPAEEPLPPPPDPPTPKPEPTTPGPQPPPPTER